MNTNQNNQRNHLFFMKLAFAQANKNLGNTNENPSVGCVITKNNSVISSGCTGLNGRPHAEINAINFSKTSLKNSNLYVTLEPCSHYGKTPPCTKSIIKSKFKKVFFSISDPDLRSYNKSISILKNKKISTHKGVYSNTISSFYRSYIKSKSSLLPFVTCKIAVSKDFFTINKKKEWITNEFSRGRVHLIRANHDCIITSSKTIISDNSELTCRINGLKNKSPSRIILDSKLRTPLNAKIIKEANNFRTIIFYNKFNKRKIKQLKDLNIQTYKIPLDVERNLDLKVALIKAKQLGFYRIILEVGKRLTINFLYKNLVDELKLFISNKNLGKNGISCIKRKLKLFLKNKNSHLERVNLFGDKLITYKIN